jgi:hypothetical protein
MIDTQSADLIARHINALNAQRMQRADAAGFIVAIILGLLAAMALWHWGLHCNVLDGALCTLAAIPTRRNPLRRLQAAAQAWYLRLRIRAAEEDAQHHAEMAELAPELAQLARNYAAQLRVELAEVEAR